MYLLLIFILRTALLLENRTRFCNEIDPSSEHVSTKPTVQSVAYRLLERICASSRAHCSTVFTAASRYKPKNGSRNYKFKENYYGKTGPTWTRLALTVVSWARPIPTVRFVRFFLATISSPWRLEVGVTCFLLDNLAIRHHVSIKANFRILPDV